MFGIVRVEKRKKANMRGCVAHLARTRETPNADPQRLALNEHHGTPLHRVIEQLNGRLARIEANAPVRKVRKRDGTEYERKQKLRKDAVVAMEVLVTATPEFFDGPNSGAAFFAAGRDWAANFFGADNVLSATVHRDEKTPHMHLLVVPDDGGKLNAKKWVGSPAKLRALQDDFHAAVGHHFGLNRGKKGSKAKHEAVSTLYGDLERKKKAAELRLAKMRSELSELLRASEKAEAKAAEKAEWAEKLEAHAKALKAAIEQVQQTHHGEVALRLSKLRRSVDQLSAQVEQQTTENEALRAELRRFRPDPAPVNRAKPVRGPRLR